MQYSSPATAPNPFHFLPASSSEFVGRWPLVREMETELRLGRNSFACIGGRRFGKSSVLQVVFEVLRTSSTPDQAVLPVLMDVALHDFASPEQFFWLLLRTISRQVDSSVPASADDLVTSRISLAGTDIVELLSASDRAVTGDQFLEAVGEMLRRLEYVSQAGRLVLLLDELDRLMDYPWHTLLFNQLRACLLEGGRQSRLRMVLAGSRWLLEAISGRGSPAWNVLSLEYLQALDEPSTRQIIARATGLPAEVAGGVWRFSGGHPFIAVWLLRHLWKRGAAQALATEVISAANQFMQQEERHLKGWCTAIGPLGVKAYAAFARTDEWLESAQLIRGIDGEDAAESLTALAYHGLIVPNADYSAYRRSGDLFRDWFLRKYA